LLKIFLYRLYYSKILYTADIGKTENWLYQYLTLTNIISIFEVYRSLEISSPENTLSHTIAI